MLGPVILDVVGCELSSEEREIVQHPSVGGVILFARNYESPKQISALCADIRKARRTPLLITVDQEGGRVQRFKEGFTMLPDMGQLGKHYEKNPTLALELAKTCGWLMAAELLAVGVDLSFAPVLDLDKGENPAIGNRAFHADPTIVIALADALIQGMREAGMSAIGKHFPGHGTVKVDSHIGTPRDSRPYETIEADDLQTFSKLIQLGIHAIMPAHIIFSEIDENPVGFSRYWLQTILRKKLNFEGVIISDDLNMQGAAISNQYVDRARSALEAGCDLILICNNPSGAIEILDHLPQTYFLKNEKFKLMQGNFSENFTALRASKQWQKNNLILQKGLS